MISQRYKFYLVHLLLGTIMILSAGCNSTRLAQKDGEITVRSTVETFIKAMNTEDIKTLELLYAEDFKSYAPIYDLPKSQLLKSIQNGFKNQDHQIKAKIIEIISGPTVATVELDWMIINENNEIIYSQDLLQVWKMEKNNWKLNRILFYAASKVPEAGDFKF